MNQKSLICIATISSLTAAFLAGILIATTLHPFHHRKPPNPTNTTNTTTPFDFGISSNASHILRSNNFTFIATLLTVSPNLFLSSPKTTIFAIPDSVMSNLTIPPYMSLQLLNYHISPSKLTFQDLLQNPLNTCFPTNFQHQKISITKTDPKNHLLALNNALITHPDMFLIPSLVIHGVNGPFASFKSDQQTNDFPICNTNNNTAILPKFDLTENKFEWKMVVKFLGLSGYAPFAFGLYNVLDGVIKEHPSLDSMTIFVPPTIEVMQMPSSVVSKLLRSHIVPKKYSYKHLAGLSRGSLIKTLCPGKAIEITGNDELNLLLIDRVEMTSPDLVVSKSFVVHGIARAFAMNGVLI